MYVSYSGNGIEKRNNNAVLVYDGLPKFVSLDSYRSSDSTLIASFSSYKLNNNKKKFDVEAKSGIMTIYYADNGWDHVGFNASYEVLSCPNNCPEDANRECKEFIFSKEQDENNPIKQTSSCTCKQGWIGKDCQTPLCTNECNEENNEDANSTSNKQCVSEKNNTCLLKNLDNSQIKVTTLQEGIPMPPNVGVFDSPHNAYPKLLPRFGHTLELDHHSGTIWVFGGFSHTFNSALNDIRAFDTLEEKWIPITVQIPSTHVEKKSKSLSHRSKRKNQMKSKPIKRGKQNNRNKITGG